MKYAVLAALLATVSAADKKANGCKAGITGKLYSDTTCKTEVKSTFTLMEHHVKFTGDCVTGKASTDQVDNAATAASNFKKAQRETKKKLDVVNAVEKIQVDDATKKEDPKMTEKPVAEAFKAKYPELKKKYVAWQEANAVYQKYLETYEDSSEHAAVAAYYDEYKDWYKATINTLDESKDDQDTRIAEELADRNTAKGNLPKAAKTEANLKIVEDAAVKSSLFKKQKIQEFDKSLELNKKCVANGDSVCVAPDQAKMQATTQKYIIADAEYDTALAYEKKQEASSVQAADAVDKANFATKTTCDDKGIVHEEWDDPACTGKAGKKFDYEWGACLQSPDGKNYIAITGAAALQAAAVALVAFAGSQF